MADGGDDQQEARRTEPKSMEEESKEQLDLNLEPRGTSDDRTEHRNETEPEKREGGESGVRTTTGSAQRDVEMQTRSRGTESRALPLKKRRRAMDLEPTQSNRSNGIDETKPEKRVLMRQDISQGKGYSGLRINEDNLQRQRLREFESQTERDARLLRQRRALNLGASELERQRRSHETQYDCYNYVNTGRCILGNSCPFNHPHQENRDWSYDERRGYETESRSMPEIRGRNILDSRDQDRDLWRGFEENQREQRHQTIEWQRRGDQENEQEQRIRESIIPDSRDRDPRELFQEIRDEEDCIYELEKKFNMDISQIKDTIAAGIKRAKKENRSIIPRGYPVEQRHGNIGATSTEAEESVKEQKLEGQNLDSEPGESSDQRHETEPENRENGVSGSKANGNGHHDSRERFQDASQRFQVSEMRTRPVRNLRDRDPRKAFFERQRREAQEMQLASSSGIQNAPVLVTNPRLDMSGDRTEGNQSVQPSPMAPENKDEQVSQGSLVSRAPETVGRALLPEHFRASPPDTQNNIRWAQRIQRGEPVDEDDASMIATQEENDRMFAEALSKHFQEEILASQQPRFVQPLTYVLPEVHHIDPEYLAALPPNMQREVIRTQILRAHDEPNEEENDIDLEEYEIDIEALEAFPQGLREKAYLDCSQAELEALPPHLRAEARMYRDQEMHRQLIQRDIERMEKLRLKASTVLNPQELERLRDIIRRLSDEILERYEQARMANTLMDSRKLKTSGDIVLDILKRFKQERMAVNRSVNAQENPVEQGQVDIEMQRREAEDQELEELIAQYERDIKEQ